MHALEARMDTGLQGIVFKVEYGIKTALTFA